MALEMLFKKYLVTKKNFENWKNVYLDEVWGLIIA